MPWTEILDKVQFSAEKLVKVNLFESERMFCDVYSLLPGQQQKVHTHDDADKIYVALSGSPTVILGEEQRALSPMHAAWAPAGVAHGVRNDGAEQATLLVFQARAPQSPSR
jgi:quercetin dioxygenase-like cupin family protein